VMSLGFGTLFFLVPLRIATGLKNCRVTNLMGVHWHSIFGFFDVD
jgi:hypothetical protein